MGELADAGVTVAAFGSGISEIALHFLERYHIIVQGSLKV